MQDIWLILQCQRGNPDAFAALYERHHRRIFRTVLYMVHDHALAEEVT